MKINQKNVVFMCFSFFAFTTAQCYNINYAYYVSKKDPQLTVYVYKNDKIFRTSKLWEMLFSKENPYAMVDLKHDQKNIANLPKTRLPKFLQSSVWEIGPETLFGITWSKDREIAKYELSPGDKEGYNWKDIRKKYFTANDTAHKKVLVLVTLKGKPIAWGPLMIGGYLEIGWDKNKNGKFVIISYTEKNTVLWSK